jgi:hypothetical protein
MQPGSGGIPGAPILAAAAPASPQSVAVTTITAGRHAGRTDRRPGLRCWPAARGFSTAAATTITAGRRLTRQHRSAPRPAVLAGRPGLQHRRGHHHYRRLSCWSAPGPSGAPAPSVVWPVLDAQERMLLISRILAFKRPIYASPLLFEVGNFFLMLFIMMRCISRKTRISHRLPCQ